MKKSLAKLIKGMQDADESQADIDARIAKALADNTHDDDRPKPHDSVLTRIDKAASDWDKSKDESPANDADEANGKGQGGNDGNGAPAKDKDKVEKAAGETEADKAAAALIAKAVTAAVGDQLKDINAKVAKALQRIEAVGDLGFEALLAQRDNTVIMAKGQGAAVSDPQMPALLEKVGKLEKAVEAMTTVLKAPAGGFRGYVDPAEIEAALHPGDDANKDKTIRKGDDNYVALGNALLLKQREAVGKDQGLVERISKAISNLNLNPGLAEDIAEEFGVKLD